VVAEKESFCCRGENFFFTGGVIRYECIVIERSKSTQGPQCCLAGPEITGLWEGGSVREKPGRVLLQLPFCAASMAICPFSPKHKTAPCAPPISKEKYATKTAQVMDIDKRFIWRLIYAPMVYLSRRKVVIFSFSN